MPKPRAMGVVELPIEEPAVAASEGTPSSAILKPQRVRSVQLTMTEYAPPVRSLHVRVIRVEFAAELPSDWLDCGPESSESADAPEADRRLAGVATGRL